ncbi:MAG: STAS domain-containing protein [Nocardioidaceae bacterium]
MAVSSVTDQVHLGTHVDVRNVAEARATLNAVLETAGGDVVVDLAGLEVIDAAGLGMLTAAHLRCERAGHHLILRNCPNEIRRVFALTRLNRIFHLERDDTGDDHHRHATGSEEDGQISA